MTKWDKKFAESYRILRVEDNYIVRPFLSRLFGDMHGKTVIDLGCGQGIYSRLFAKKGGRVTGIDKSSFQMKIALEEENKRPLGINYINNDVANTKLKPSSFDIALLSFVLIDLPSKKKFISVMKEAKRLLKNNGILIVCDVHPHNFNRKNSIDSVIAGGKNYFHNCVKCSSVVRLINGKTLTFYPDYHYTLEFFINTLADVGFSIVRFIEPEYKEPFPQYMIIIAKKVMK